MNICVKNEFGIWNTATDYRHKNRSIHTQICMSTYVVILGIAHVTLKSCIFGLKQDTYTMKALSM